MAKKAVGSFERELGELGGAARTRVLKVENRPSVRKKTQTRRGGLRKWDEEGTAGGRVKMQLSANQGSRAMRSSKRDADCDLACQDRGTGDWRAPRSEAGASCGAAQTAAGARGSVRSGDEDGATTDGQDGGTMLEATARWTEGERAAISVARMRREGEEGEAGGRGGAEQQQGAARKVLLKRGEGRRRRRRRRRRQGE